MLCLAVSNGANITLSMPNHGPTNAFLAIPLHLALRLEHDAKETMVPYKFTLRDEVVDGK